MTRILLLGHAFPLVGADGPAAADPLLSALAAYSAVWVDVVTSSPTRDRYETERFAERITIYRVPVAHVPAAPFTSLELLRYAWRGLHFCRLLLERRRYDVSFAWPCLPAGCVSFLLKRRHGLPYLVLLQEADVFDDPAGPRRRSALLEPLIWAVWREATTLTALNPLGPGRLPARPVASLADGADPPAWPGDDGGRGHAGQLSWPAIARRCLQLCEQAAPR